MTAKEKAQELLTKKADNYNTIDLNAYAMGLSDMISALEPKWIKIESEDDLPKEFCNCWINIKGVIINTPSYFNPLKKEWENRGMIVSAMYISEYMIIPQPPKD